MKSGAIYALPWQHCGASTPFAKLVGQVPPIILARLLYLGAGPGLLVRVLQVLGNCAMRLLVK
jgi:hypothetical protein